MNKTKIALALVLSSISSWAAADLNYTNFSIGYVDGDTFDVNTDGFSLAGSFAFTDRFHALASYDSLDAEGTDVDVLKLGAGYHAGIGSDMDFVTTFSLEDVDIGNFSSDGIQITGGIRGGTSNSFEYFADLVYEDIDDIDSDTGLAAGIRFFPSRDLSFGINYRNVNEFDMLKLDIRFDY